VVSDDSGSRQYLADFDFFDPYDDPPNMPVLLLTSDVNFALMDELGRCSL
jgi:hypothetical protein